MPILMHEPAQPSAASTLRFTDGALQIHVLLNWNVEAAAASISRACIKLRVWEWSSSLFGDAFVANPDPAHEEATGDQPQWRTGSSHSSLIGLHALHYESTAHTIDIEMTTEELIGEELVDASNVNAFADRMFAEAERLWASPSSGWVVLSKSPVLNESIAVSGAFASARVDVVRATATVAAPAQFVFDLLVSPEGYKIIDPFSDPKDHEKPPLESFETSTWRDHDGLKRLEVTSAVAKIPLMHTREFVVLNAIDAQARMFASKSIQHSSVPGASAWGPTDAQAALDSKTVRALNTFAVRVEPAEGKDATSKCVVRFINYANLAGRFSPSIQNQFNKTFLTAVVSRLQKAVKKAKVPGGE